MRMEGRRGIGAGKDKEGKGSPKVARTKKIALNLTTLYTVNCRL